MAYLPGSKGRRQMPRLPTSTVRPRPFSAVMASSDSRPTKELMTPTVPISMRRLPVTSTVAKSRFRK